MSFANHRPIARRTSLRVAAAVVAAASTLGTIAEAAAPANPDVIRSAIPAVGVYRKASSTFWVDVNADKAPELNEWYGQVGNFGLLADITGSGTRVPVIFHQGVWYFDFDGDGGTDRIINFGQAGDVPLVADVNNDGRDDLVVYRSGTWLVSTTGDGALSSAYAFSGASYADILWRETATGALGAFMMKNGTTPVWSALGTVSNDWTIVGMGDFNGDRRMDILWRETSTGSLGVYFMSGTTPTWAPIGGSAAGWSILGIGDLDGNGKADVLWRETATGNLGAWLMNGASASWVPMGPMSLAWQYAGIGDFDGDGKADVLWKDASGNLAISFLGAGRFGTLAGAGSGWSIAGIGDFNGDRRDDIVWRNGANGEVRISFQNGVASGWASLGIVDPGWQLQGIRDFNGDGRADLLWRETATGNIGLYQMNGATPTWVVIGNASPAWQVAGVGDMGPTGDVLPVLGDVDGDGIVDLLLYDNGTWFASANRTSLIGATYAHGGAPGDVPIAIDWDGDGVDDLAVVNGPAWNVKSIRPGGFVGTYDLGIGAVGDTPLYWGNGYVPNPRLEAARFLSHATFGPTDADVANVLQWGYAGWIDQQLSIPATRYTPMGWWPQNQPSPPTGTTWPTCTSAFYFSGASYSTASPCNCSVASGVDQCSRDVYSTFDLQRQFFVNALTAPDQLRQRVAWALSQIIVTSAVQDSIVYPMRDYQQLLVDNAFDLYETLLWRVTSSPWMGNWLDMVNNARSLSATQQPNENYAREIMQLFSIGLWKLNPDGTQMLDAGGSPIPTYTQADITELARALTGWTYAPLPGANARWNAPINYTANMVPIEGALTGTGTTNYHDTGAKTVMGVTQPAGTRAADDVVWAVMLVARHANTAPFMSKQLIQHLVTSNPSPAYVQRVAAVWSSTFGSLREVVKAILLDPEALAPENLVSSSVGKLKEPVLAITSFLRRLGATSDGVYLRGGSVATAMGQEVFRSETVFNYYSAEYMIPGTGLAGPPFNIFDATRYFARTNFFYNVTLGSTACDTALSVCGPAPDVTVVSSRGTKIDYTALKALAADPMALVGAVDSLLLYGTMPKAQKLAIASAVGAIALSAPATQQQLLDRARTAVYLTATSPKFQVEH